MAQAIEGIHRQVSAGKNAIKEALKSTTDAVLRQRSLIEKQNASTREGYKGIGGAAKKTSDLVKRAMAEEKAARERLTGAIKAYRVNIKAADKATTQASREATKAAKEQERATAKAAKEANRLARNAERASQKFKNMILGIGKGSSSSGLGKMISQVGLLTGGIVGLHSVLRKFGEAKDQFLKFDELTSASLAITKPGVPRYQRGGEGFKEYREMLRETADAMRTTSDEMAGSAHFWVKAGQRNLETIGKLSQVGTMFARANRDASNNILEQARANDILSDMLTLFREDTSTPEKAMEAATRVGDQITNAANASNIVAEQLFDFSTKVGSAFKAGEVDNKQILSIAASLASAGIKDTSGVHVRQIFTRLNKENVQDRLKKLGVDVVTEEGKVDNFGDIFANLQEVLQKMAPTDRIKELQSLFGQRAYSTAAALAGLNEGGEGVDAATSVKAIEKAIAEGSGTMERMQAEYYKTTSGRLENLSSSWSNTISRMLDHSNVLGKVIDTLETVDPDRVIGWIEMFIEAIGKAYDQLSDWFSPALEMISELFGSVTGSADGLADVITTVVKLWVKWRIALLALQGLRTVDWMVSLVSQLQKTVVATKAVGAATTGMATATEASVARTSTAVGKLPGVFSAAGIGIIAAIAAWGIAEAIYDNVIQPVRQAARELDAFRKRTDKQELSKDIETLIAEEAVMKQSIADQQSMQETGDIYTAGITDVKNDVEIDAKRKDLERKRRLIAERVAKEYNVTDSTSDLVQEIAKKRANREPLPMGTGPIRSVNDARADYNAAIASETNKDVAQENLEASLQRAARAAEDAYDDAKLSMAQLKENIDAIQEGEEEDRTVWIQMLREANDALSEASGNMASYANELKTLRSEEASREQKKNNLPKPKPRGTGGRDKERRDSHSPFEMFSGLDEKGNRVVNLAVPDRGVNQYLQHEDVRQGLKQNLARNNNVSSVHYGDQSVTITVKTNANPEEIAKAASRELNRMARIERQRDEREFARRIGQVVPGEI